LNKSRIGIRDVFRFDEETKDAAMLKQKYATSKKMVCNASLENVAETLLRFVAFCVSWISTPSVIKALSIKQGCVSCALVTRQLDGIGLGLAESGGSMKKKLNNAPTMSQLQKIRKVLWQLAGKDLPSSVIWEGKQK